MGVGDIGVGTFHPPRQIDADEQVQDPIDAVRRHPTPFGPRNRIRHVIGACRAIKTSERLEYGGAHRSPLFAGRSEEHTSELQSLMRISYAVFCLKKTTNTPNT